MIPACFDVLLSALLHERIEAQSAPPYSEGNAPCVQRGLITESVYTVYRIAA